MSEKEDTHTLECKIDSVALVKSLGVESKVLVKDLADRGEIDLDDFLNLFDNSTIADAVLEIEDVKDKLKEDLWDEIEEDIIEDKDSLKTVRDEIEKNLREDDDFKQEVFDDLKDDGDYKDQIRDEVKEELSSDIDWLTDTVADLDEDEQTTILKNSGIAEGFVIDMVKVLFERFPHAVKDVLKKIVSEDFKQLKPKSE